MVQMPSTGGSAHCGVFPPPPGVVANCTNPATQTASNIALHTIMIFFATVSLSVRLYTRYFILHGIGLDDFLCVIAFGLLVAYSVMLLLSGNYYVGRHIWDITKADFIYGHKLEVVAEWLYCFISPTLKLAVLWFYRHIFGPQTRVNWIINGGIIFNIIAYTALFFLSLLTCLPLERRWNPFIAGNCLPSGVTAYLSGAINVLTDAFVLFLPLPIIARMTMPFAQKVRALAVFSLGIIVLALSITRLAKTPSVFKITDATWEISRFAIYSILELYIGLICICFLASPSFIDRFGPNLVTRLRSYTSSLGSSSTNKTQETPLDNVTNGKDESAKTSTSGVAVASQVERKPESDLEGSLKQQDSTTALRPFNTFPETRAGGEV